VIHQRSELTANDRLVIFVHGLGGSRYGRRSTWGEFPRLIGSTRETPPFNHAEALRDETHASTRQFHDPTYENSNCQLREILEVEYFHTRNDAIVAGYDGCFRCG
jgi:hypothetical protein